MQPTLPDDEVVPAPPSAAGGARALRSPVVIVHHLGQAKAVLRIASQTGLAVQLQSAPGAAAFAGVGYLKALGDAIDHELLIDCGDDAGLVMAALRTGCGKLMFSGSADERRRLGQMAEKSGALLLGPEGSSSSRLFLSVDDDCDGDVVRAWLHSKAET